MMYESHAPMAFKMDGKPMLTAAADRVDRLGNCVTFRLLLNALLIATASQLATVWPVPAEMGAVARHNNVQVTKTVYPAFVSMDIAAPVQIPCLMDVRRTWTVEATVKDADWVVSVM